MADDFYTVNYRLLDEFEDDTTVLGIDFDSLDNASKFYTTIVTGNGYGEGYAVELLHCFVDDCYVAVLNRHEF
jgi:hypothetical protein